MRKIGLTAVLAFALPVIPAICFGQVLAKPVTHVIKSMDLSKAFATRSPWKFIASQGPDVTGPSQLEPVPGVLFPCLTPDNGKTCLPETDSALRRTKDADLLSEPHALVEAKVLHAQANRALLLLQLGSWLTGDGDRLIGNQVYAYDQGRDLFTQVYARVEGHNNNQEVRFIENGPLQGNIIAVTPTENAPFGYWVSVNSLAEGNNSYKEVLRYRSATTYGDGNPLAVIDAEMPNIQSRMGLWKPGMPLPTPHDCKAPKLVKTVLWCH